MKFQNPSFNFFLNGRANGQTDKRTNKRTSRKQYAPHFFKVGGIKIPHSFVTRLCAYNLLRYQDHWYAGILDQPLIRNHLYLVN